MYSLENQVVLITGASSGIGAAISNEVLKEGAKHVRLLDIDESAGIRVQNELNSKYGTNKTKFVKCDVTIDDQLFKAMEDVKEETGYLDVVFNNAGVINEVNYKAIRRLIEINYIAVVNGTLKAVELMDKSNGGRGGTIINTASIAGLYPITQPLYAYASSKSAVLQFTSCIGKVPFYDDTGIRVISLCFGATETKIFDNVNTFENKSDEHVWAVLQHYPNQSVESAAHGAVEAYKKGKCASVWLIQHNKPAVDITEDRQKCHDAMAQLLFNNINVPS